MVIGGVYREPLVRGDLRVGREDFVARLVDFCLCRADSKSSMYFLAGVRRIVSPITSRARSSGRLKRMQALPMLSLTVRKGCSVITQNRLHAAPMC